MQDEYFNGNNSTICRVKMQIKIKWNICNGVSHETEAALLLSLLKARWSYKLFYSKYSISRATLTMADKGHKYNGKTVYLDGFLIPVAPSFSPVLRIVLTR